MALVVRDAYASVKVSSSSSKQENEKRMSSLLVRYFNHKFSMIKYDTRNKAKTKLLPV